MTKPTRVKSAFSAIKTGEDGDSYIYTITFTGKLTKVQADSASPSVAEAISKWCQRKFPQREGKVIIDLRVPCVASRCRGAVCPRASQPPSRPSSAQGYLSLTTGNPEGKVRPKSTALRP